MLMPKSDPPLSAAQASEQTDIPKRTILYNIATGALPAHKLAGYNGVYLIYQDDLDKWVAKREAKSA